MGCIGQSAQRCRKSKLGGEELVIGRHDLDDPATRVTKYRKVAQQAKQVAVIEHPFHQRLELGIAGRRDGFPVYRSPRHEALFIRSQGPNTRLDAIGRDQHRIGPKQRRYLRLVGLQLIEGAGQRCVLVAGVLQLEHTQRQAIDEQHDIRPPVITLFDDRELVHRQPVVQIEATAAVQIDQANPVPAHMAVVVIFDRHTLDQILVQPPVLFDQRRRLARQKTADRLLARVIRYRWIQARHRIVQTIQEHYVLIGRAQRLRAVWRYIRSARNSPAQFTEPFERRFLDMVFGELAHSMSAGLSESRWSRIIPASLSVSSRKQTRSALPS